MNNPGRFDVRIAALRGPAARINFQLFPSSSYFSSYFLNNNLPLRLWSSKSMSRFARVSSRCTSVPATRTKAVNYQYLTDF